MVPPQNVCSPKGKKAPYMEFKTLVKDVRSKRSLKISCLSRLQSVKEEPLAITQFNYSRKSKSSQLLFAEY